MNPEQKVEKRLLRRVRERGGMCIKMAPTVAGMPDRLVILPGLALLVELKAPGGRLRPIQRWFHQRAADLRWPVTVLSSTKEVDDWASGLDEQ
jgi:hypothetical protein